MIFNIIYLHQLNEANKDSKISQVVNKEGIKRLECLFFIHITKEKKREPSFNVSIENSETLPIHLDLSQVDESKGYQPATHKAIERIMLLQQQQEELGIYYHPFGMMLLTTEIIY